MEKRVIDPKKRREVQSLTTKIIIAITAVIFIYVAYALIKKDLNIVIFEVLLMIFVLAYVILNDFVEPYLLGIFKEMTIGQRGAFQKILVLDVVGIGAVIYWIVGMGAEDSNGGSIFPLLIYILAAQMKRRFRPEFEGTEPKEEQEETKHTQGEQLAVEDKEEENK